MSGMLAVTMEYHWVGPLPVHNVSHPVASSLKNQLHNKLHIITKQTPSTPDETKKLTMAAFRRKTITQAQSPPPPFVHSPSGSS
jgi:hypothetical protein